MIPDNPCLFPFRTALLHDLDPDVFSVLSWGSPTLSTKNPWLCSPPLQCQGTLCCFLEISWFPLSISLRRMRTISFCLFTWLFRCLEGTLAFRALGNVSIFKSDAWISWGQFAYQICTSDIQSVWEPVPKPYIFLSYRSQLKKISEREFSFQPQKARLEWGSHIMPAGKEILP